MHNAQTHFSTFCRHPFYFHSLPLYLLFPFSFFALFFDICSFVYLKIRGKFHLSNVAQHIYSQHFFSFVVLFLPHSIELDFIFSFCFGTIRDNHTNHTSQSMNSGNNEANNVWKYAKSAANSLSFAYFIGPIFCAAKMNAIKGIHQKFHVSVNCFAFVWPKTMETKAKIMKSIEQNVRLCCKCLYQVSKLRAYIKFSDELKFFSEVD